MSQSQARHWHLCRWHALHATACHRFEPDVAPWHVGFTGYWLYKMTARNLRPLFMSEIYPFPPPLPDSQSDHGFETRSEQATF